MSEPLALPHGSIRALLALLLTGTCCFLWGTAQVVPSDLLVITSGVVAFYFASRQGEVKEEALPPVFVPAEDE